MRPIFYFTILLFSNIFCSCDLLDSKQNVLDSKILGSWYNVSIDSSVDRDSIRITGIQIDNDYEIRELAVELSTGRLSLIGADPIGLIEKLQDGKITYKTYTRGLLLGGTYNSTYKIKDDTFFNLSRDAEDRIPLKYSYKKSELNVKVADPVVSKFEIEVGNYQFINSPISAIPSAYSYNDMNNLVIVAENTHKKLFIHIYDFIGMRDYDTNSVYVSYMDNNGETFGSINTNQDSSTINLSVNYANDKCL